ncbi:unnamed protein product [Rotaria sp. Silwood2]|nr:unnamed protein product [Rotaria sp. Silwood2]CAF2595422.1 unnamed protein product [Rotaria sp. Silwood2]CAF3248562.1 unnamed protein product [Rotaria sp. Silwood2]CAF3415196.1 unnamed protein product [Rotaria sp. Silwood2]CAF4023374.1 unnamed protein product [Rotaria sp. Silwood2]
MNKTDPDSFGSLYDALVYVGVTSGLYINETLALPRLKSKWSSFISILPLILGLIGLIFNILALLIFKTSKTFQKNSFRYYIYAFAIINCASVLTHSWLYLIFYLVDPIHFCKYLQYLQQSTATTSLWIMVLLSLERSLTFSLPFAIKKLLQSHTICFILVFVTCLCFALHIDELISVDVKAFRWVNFAYGLCSVKRHFHLLTERIEIITHANSFILPFLFNSVLDIYICYKICQRRKRIAIRSSLLSSSNNQNRTKRKHQRLKKSLAHEITLTLLCQSMWLLFTYFPTHLYYFLISFKLINDHDRDNSTVNFFMRQNLLIYLAFSPALYVILSPTLRKEIHSYICQSYKRHRTISLSHTSNSQNKFRNFFFDRYNSHHSHHQQQHSTQQINLAFSVTTCEKVTGKFVSKSSISVPLKIQYISKSLPCLLIYNNKYEFDEHCKIERSNTVHK